MENYTKMDCTVIECMCCILVWHNILCIWLSWNNIYLSSYGAYELQFELWHCFLYWSINHHQTIQRWLWISLDLDYRHIWSSSCDVCEDVMDHLPLQWWWFHALKPHSKVSEAEAKWPCSDPTNYTRQAQTACAGKMFTRWRTEKNIFTYSHSI